MTAFLFLEKISCSVGNSITLRARWSSVFVLDIVGSIFSAFVVSVDAELSGSESIRCCYRDRISLRIINQMTINLARVLRFEWYDRVGFTSDLSEMMSCDGAVFHAGIMEIFQLVQHERRQGLLGWSQVIFRIIETTTIVFKFFFVDNVSI